MDNTKNDAYYVSKMLKDINFIIDNTKGITLHELEDNEILCDSVMFRLIQLSENSSKISQELKTEHSEIMWQAIKGMRNRIVHEYGEVDLKIIYQTITQDIPDICEKLGRLV